LFTFNAKHKHSIENSINQSYANRVELKEPTLFNNHLISDTIILPITNHISKVKIPRKRKRSRKSKNNKKLDSQYILIQDNNDTSEHTSS